MRNSRILWFCLVILSVALLLAGCRPSAEQLRARDDARAAALAAEARAEALEGELESLPGEIADRQAQVEALETELAELQQEFYSLGGSGR